MFRTEIVLIIGGYGEGGATDEIVAFDPDTNEVGFWEGGKLIVPRLGAALCRVTARWRATIIVAGG